VNTPPTNAGPPVGPPSGYQTSTDGMSSAARKIHDAAEDSQGDIKGLHPTKLADKDFGTKHTQWYADYAASIDALGAGSDAMCTNLSAFSGQLGGAAGSYSANDGSSAASLSQSGQQ
jgi:hypothetical protein